MMKREKPSLMVKKQSAKVEIVEVICGTLLFDKTRQAGL